MRNETMNDEYESDYYDASVPRTDPNNPATQVMLREVAAGLVDMPHRKAYHAIASRLILLGADLYDALALREVVMEFRAELIAQRRGLSPKPEALEPIQLDPNLESLDDLIPRVR